MKKIIIIILISLVVLGIAATIGLSMVAKSVIASLADTRIEKNDHSLTDFGLDGEQIEVLTSDGIKINAYIVPHKESKGNVLVLHGMHGMDATSLFDYAKFLYEAGYTPICVDMRAHGKSDGEALSFGYLETLDIKAVVSYINTDERLKGQPIILYGLSMGGSSALNYATKYKDIDAVIAVSPFSSIQNQVADYMLKDDAPTFFVDMFKPFVNTNLKKKFGVDPIKESPIENIKNIGDIPIFIVHGDKDTQTEFYQAKDLYDNCNSTKKELWIVKDKDHLIVEDILAEDSEFYRARIIEFLGKTQ